jgi:hypothetical protein
MDHRRSLEQYWRRRLPGSFRAHYAATVDVKRAADLYAQRWTLRQIGAELGVHWSTVSEQLQKVGITIRSSGPPAHAASTDQIMALHDPGLTWNEVARQVDMTFQVPGAATGGPSRQGRHGWAVGSRFFLMRLRRTSRLASVQPSLIISVEPPRGLSSPPHAEPPTVSPPSAVPACCTLRGLAVARSEVAGRKSPHNHAQTAHNLRRSLRNAAAGARPIEVDGLDSQSAAEVAVSLVDALDELHWLRRRIDRRIRRDHGPQKDSSR